jgi:LmbE family N-acetylglucosaminyl deacetylase
VATQRSMFGVSLDRTNGPLRVLCVGAHCDDIEIGCGGTLLALQEQRKSLVIDWAVLSGDQTRRRETAKAMRLFTRPAHRGKLLFGDFPDGRFPACYEAIKRFVESAKSTLDPHVVLCHEREDRHQDHRIVNEMVWNSFRHHLVLEFEVPKWDGGLGQPNVYFALTAKQARAKVAALERAYQSQRARDWFRADLFLALLRLRGMECRSPSGYAEGFHGRKIALGII